MADDALRVFRRAFAPLDGRELHERITALLSASVPGRPRAALRAVLAMHEPVPGDWGTSCSCWDRRGSHPAYPCREVSAILMELAEGERAPDGDTPFRPTDPDGPGATIRAWLAAGGGETPRG